MAALKRSRGTWALIILLAAGFFLLRERRVLAVGNVTISSPMTFAVADASNGVVDGVFTVAGNLTITGTGNITCNDPSSPSGDSACPIRIAVSGDLVMDAGSAILAKNNVDGGSGGDIEIIVAGNMTMHGTSGLIPGAEISSSRTSGTGGAAAGDIRITVGNLSTTPPTGDFTMETGSQILANSTGSAGAIVINVALAADVDGLVQSRGEISGVGANQPPGGGPITINAGCSLLVSDTRGRQQRRARSGRRSRPPPGLQCGHRRTRAVGPGRAT